MEFLNTVQLYSLVLYEFLHRFHLYSWHFDTEIGCRIPTADVLE